MGVLIRLEDHRARRDAYAQADPVRDLELAVHRLDPAVAQAAAADGTLDPRVQTELLAITGAVTMGMTEEALERAERLADRLEHPTARRRRLT
jgi:hypothetical protein